MKNFNDFLSEKNISEDEFSKLESSKQAELYAEFNEAKTKALEDAIEAKASSDDIEKLKSELNESTQKEFVALKKSIEEQGKAIKTMLKSNITESPENFKSALKKAVAEKADQIKALPKTGGRVVFPVGEKAAAIFTQANNAGSGTTSELVLPGISIESRTRPSTIDVVNTVTTGAETIRYVEMVNRDGDAAMQAENADIALADFDVTQNTASMKMVGVRSKTTDQILRYVEDLNQVIESELAWRLRLKLSTQALSGDNTGNNLKGIQEFATTFAAGNLANQVDGANKFDVLRAAAAQVRRNNVLRATEAYAVPSVALMHPDDVASLDLAKDANGNYLMPPWKSGDSTYAGLTIIEEDSITADNFVVMDPNLAHLYISNKPLQVEIGYSEDDFDKGNLTMRLFTYATHFIKDNETGAFIKGDFTTAAAALETP